jgi:hypothetical protein
VIAKTRKRILSASVIVSACFAFGWYWVTSSSGCFRLEINRSFHDRVVFNTQRIGVRLVAVTTLYQRHDNGEQVVAKRKRQQLTEQEQVELLRILDEARGPLVSRAHGFILDGSTWTIRIGGPLTDEQSYRSPGTFGPDPVWKLGAFFWRIANKDEPIEDLY